MSNNRELVSIIVPVFQVKEYLGDCLDSILNQTYSNIEVILIDDGSTDGSSEICDEYRKRDDRINVVHMPNGGVSRARNEGLSMKRGELVVFIDSDDIVSACYIETLVSVFHETGGDVISCSSSRDISAIANLNDVSEYSTNYVMSGKDAMVDTLYQGKISNGPHAKLFTAQVVAGMLFRNDIAIAEDLEFNCRVFAGTKKLVHIDAPLYGYRERSGSALSSEFNPRKLDEIKSSRIIYDGSEDEDVRLAAVNRLFTSSLFVAVQIPKKRLEYRVYLEECMQIVRDFRGLVLHDHKSRLAYRLLAFSAYVSTMTPVNIMKMKKRIARK